MVRDTLRNFVGEILQIPPNYSACKVNGKRAYDLARNDVEFELKPKLLVIDSIALDKYELPYITVSVVCSKGTYIRALARDIGTSLQSGGHLTSLCENKSRQCYIREVFEGGRTRRFFRQKYLAILF